MIWQNLNDIKSLKIGDHNLVVYGTSSFSVTYDMSEILAPDELIYSEKLRGEGQKSTWLSCRAALRLVLATHLNKSAKEIQFNKGRFGKLYVPNSDLYFNVSHSKHAFLLGFSFGGRIGVDIEKLNGSEELPALVNYAFSEKEANYCAYGKIVEFFTEVWTLKEALLKAAGVGLIDDLTSISVVGEPFNDIDHFNLFRKSFLCPNGETASIVYRKNQPLKLIRIS